MVSIKLAQMVALATALAALSGVDAKPRVDPGVHRTLRRQGTVNLIVTLKESNQATIDSVKETNYPSRGAKIEALMNRLKKHAETTQADINKVLVKEAGGPTLLFEHAKSMWISNQMSFKGASLDLVEKLAQLPSVGDIREEMVLPPPKVPLVVNTTANSAEMTVKNQWGITKTQASDVWAAGYDGEGVVVGHIDTGVQYTHEALHSNFRGAYGWFDPPGNSSAPMDDNGHGTHTLGSLAGSLGIGVAPGATWMSCRACTPNGCAESDLIACGQYMTCPTDSAGNNQDCSKAPHLVSNSWGGPGGNAFYEPVNTAWQAAGIIPVFANGNSGPECSTTNSPADSPNVIAVGMTDRWDGVDFSSSKGPAVSGLTKPDIMAPGSGIRSAWIGEDNVQYLTATGTSMAAPHVSGVIAILLSAAPFLTYSDIREILVTTTDTATLLDSGYTCGNTLDTTFPNNQYGFGRINTLKAYNEATNSDATAVPTVAPGKCDGLNFLPCIRAGGCQWNDLGECELAPPPSDSSNSGSGGDEDPTDAPTDAPTEVPTPEPTTLEPTPLPTIPAPTPAPTLKVTPGPSTMAPAPVPTTKAPSPTPCPSTSKPTKTPVPTNTSPAVCKGLSLIDCLRSKRCTWGIFTFKCQNK